MRHLYRSEFEESDAVIIQTLRPFKLITGDVLHGGLTSNEEKIARTMRPYTQEDALKDYNNLVDIHPKTGDLNKITGNLFINYYMFPYRLDTGCNRKKGVNFYDFYKNTQDYVGPRQLSFINSIANKLMKEGSTKENAYYSYYTRWFCNVAIFKPLIAKYLYEMYKPHTILDISMGWGGRLAGAMSIPNTKYIGFDTNTDLKDPYTKMIKDMNWADRCKLYFSDSAKADFSKFKYDMVFTSPPYFIKSGSASYEAYPNMPKYDSYDDWAERFFNPVMTNAYTHLEKGGTFCINTRSTDFELLKKLFGKPVKKINIRNRASVRNPRERAEIGNKIITSTEFIYIWVKHGAI
jgi:hypothetical protein